jgi:hypothetical protein
MDTNIDNNIYVSQFYKAKNFTLIFLAQESIEKKNTIAICKLLPPEHQENATFL